MSGTIKILSCGTGTPFPMTQFQKAVERCDIIAGSNSLLDQVLPQPPGVIVFDAGLLPKAEELINDAESGKLVLVLASGDSLFNGISGTLLRLAKGRNISFEIHPGVTAFQSLFSKVHLPWSEARFFSIHSGKELPQREVLSCNLATIYGGNNNSASDIALQLLEFHPQSATRQAVIADSLGTKHEQIQSGTLLELSSLENISPISILLLLPPQTKEKLTLSLGKPDEEYIHDKGLITSQEVRVIALSKLQLPYTGVLWDIGAGSGSVGIEAAGLLPQISVHAVEKNNARIPWIKKNAQKAGLANVTIHQGDAIKLLDNLPCPDAVFFGGGGKAIVPLLEKTYKSLIPGGRIVVSAITLDTIAEIRCFRPDEQIESLTIDIAKEQQLSSTSYSFYKPNNRITLYVWEKSNA